MSNYTFGWTTNGIHHSRQSNHGYVDGHRVEPMPDVHAFVAQPDSPSLCVCNRLEDSILHATNHPPRL